jgi:hypothetical protein
VSKKFLAIVIASLVLLFGLTQAFALTRAPRATRKARPLRYARTSARRSHHHGAVRARLRRLAWNPMFRPSRDSLLKQNEEIDRLELPRIQDDDELQRLKDSADLVPIVESDNLRIDPKLDPDRRYCRRWTLDFVNDLSDAYYQRFHQPIQLNSAVRTVIVQRKLRRHNRNAAPESGEIASSHLAGITVDLQRRGMTRQQVKWVEQYMAPLHERGLIEPEEERHQWVFHVMVSDRYSDWHEEQIAKSDNRNEAPAINIPAAMGLALPQR